MADQPINIWMWNDLTAVVRPHSAALHTLYGVCLKYLLIFIIFMITLVDRENCSYSHEQLLKLRTSFLQRQECWWRANPHQWFCSSSPLWHCREHKCEDDDPRCSTAWTEQRTLAVKAGISQINKSWCTNHTSSQWVCADLLKLWPSRSMVKLKQPLNLNTSRWRDYSWVWIVTKHSRILECACLTALFCIHGICIWKRKQQCLRLMVGQFHAPTSPFSCFPLSWAWYISEVLLIFFMLTCKRW